MQGDDHMMKSLDDLIAERKPKSYHKHRYNNAENGGHSGFLKKGISRIKLSRNDTIIPMSEEEDLEEVIKEVSITLKILGICCSETK